MILVSACLLGHDCKYNGGNNDNAAVHRYLEGKDWVCFCPERSGVLPAPRLPSEIRDGRVYSKAGEDVTAEFRLGAERALAFCKAHGVDRAILKARSPSCGVHAVYDGTFTGKVMPGMGITAALLAQNGVALLDEEDVAALIDKEKTSKEV